MHGAWLHAWACARPLASPLAALVFALRGAGLTSSQLVMHIDCTKSNLENGAASFGGRSLHDVSPGAPPNPYICVMRALSSVVTEFDDDGLIPLFGFGDRICGDTSVFDFSPAAAPVGVDGVVAAYAAKIASVELAGPTSFAPSIRKTMDLVRDAAKREKGKAPTFTIAVIIADGQVTAVRDTVRAIVDASRQPIAILCVGVGDGPWDEMHTFDTHLPLATPAKPDGRLFDNFRFVEYNQVSRQSAERGEDAQEALALAALAEIPAAFAACKKLRLLEAR